MKRFAFTLALLLAASPAFGQDTTSNLEAHYTFNTNGNNSTVNARHLTAAEGHPPLHATGHVGNALTHGSYQLADATFLNSDATYTLAIWLYTSARYEDEELVVGPSNQDGVILKIPRLVATENTTTGGFATRARAVTPGTPAWSFAAIVCSSGVGTFYTNASGSLVSSGMAGTWTMPSTGTKIVVGPGTAPAAVDQFRIYARALTLQDVTALAAE
jgi:hypothetical protein